MLAACAHGQRIKNELNRINVFPVPDGDTGTNLALTLRGIVDHLGPSPVGRLDEVAGGVASAAVVGARGNCGMMLSHFLIGFADGLKGLERADAPALASALMRGATGLENALDDPVEGTIVTVIRDTAQAASGADTQDLAGLIAGILDSARASLLRTPDLLPTDIVGTPVFDQKSGEFRVQKGPIFSKESSGEA